VLGGAFHERTEYPEIERKDPLSVVDNQIYSHQARSVQAVTQAFPQDSLKAPVQASSEGGGPGVEKITFEEGM
jgi:hypothetical protein